MNKLYSTLQAGISVLALCCAAGCVSAAEVSNEDELIAAVAGNSDVTLTADVALSTALPTSTTGNFVVDGKSHTLTGGNFSGFMLERGATADIKNIKMTGFSRALTNNGGKIGRIENSDFSNNVFVSSGTARGGAILNLGDIGEISDTVFRGNSVTSVDGNAFGGAIANIGSSLTLINSSFYDNYAETLAEPVVSSDDDDTGGFNAVGGAIYSQGGTLNIVSRGANVVFSGNYVVSQAEAESGDDENSGEDFGDENYGEDYDENIDVYHNGIGIDDENDDAGEIAETVQTSNAITMQGGVLNLNAESGRIIFDDAIGSPGRTYNMNVRGQGEVVLNNSVSGVENFVLYNSFLTLGKNGNLSVKTYTAVGAPFLTVTVDPDEKVASSINVDGDVVGITNVIVNTTSTTIVSPETSILFVSAYGDDPDTASDFVVYRVYGSPYMWEVKYVPTTVPEEDEGVIDERLEEDEGVKNEDFADEEPEELTGGEWFLSMTQDSNPDFRPMAPEIAAFLALPSAAVEQNRGVVSSVRNSVGANKFLLQRYNVLYEDHYKGRAVSNLWVNPVYRYVQVTVPQEWDATIAGFDAGLDLQSDASNKVGIFASYRYGTYDVSEKGYYRADMGSEIEISSYLLGAYYRYDYNNFWAFATAYAGSQHAEIETDDRVKADADAMQYGAGIELGYAFIPGENWTLEPSLGVFYTGIDYDDMKDEYGKSAEYSMLHQVEGELGVKLEKTFMHDYGYSKIYVKPSIVQTINSGNEVKITHVGKVSSLDDQTLGRLEVGGRYALDGKMSLYGYLNYTTGSDYDDVAAGLGFSYRWY